MTEDERQLRQELCRAEARLLRAQKEAQTPTQWWFAANEVIHGIRFTLDSLDAPAPPHVAPEATQRGQETR